MVWGERKSEVEQTVHAEGASNDLTHVLVHMLLVGVFTYGWVSAVSLYSAAVSATKPQSAGAETRDMHRVRLLSGWANFGNALVHIVFVVYLRADQERCLKYWDADEPFGAGTLHASCTRPARV